MEYLSIIFGWFVFSILAGIIAGARGRSGFGYFVLSMVLSPLIGIILAAALPSLNVTKDPNEPTPDTHVRCPDCRELVRFDATKCKHCGTALVPQTIDLDSIKRAAARRELISFGMAILQILGVVVALVVISSIFLAAA